MKLKSIYYSAVTSLATLWPTLAIAAVSASGSVGVQGKNGFFGISFGTGPGAGGGMFGIAACANAICGVASLILFIINSVLVPVLFAVAFIIFLYGVAQAYIFSKGDPAKVKTGHQHVLWGVIGFAIMLSLWGLVNVVSTTFGLSGFTAPPRPTSY